MFKEYKDSEKWTLVRNPNYWNKELPYLDPVEMIHAAAWSDRGTAVLTGQADLSWNVSKETWDEGAKRNDAIRTNRVTNFGAYQVIINTKIEAARRSARPPRDPPGVEPSGHDQGVQDPGADRPLALGAARRRVRDTPRHHRHAARLSRRTRPRTSPTPAS